MEYWTYCIYTLCSGDATSHPYAPAALSPEWARSLPSCHHRAYISGLYRYAVAVVFSSSFKKKKVLVFRLWSSSPDPLLSLLLLEQAYVMSDFSMRETQHIRNWRNALIIWRGIQIATETLFPIWQLKSQTQRRGVDAALARPPPILEKQERLIMISIMKDVCQ